MGNDRLRSVMRTGGFSERALGEELGVDPKTVQRWIVQGRSPHPNTARRAARLLGVPADFLWPDAIGGGPLAASYEIVNLYAHRSMVPKSLWAELATSTASRIDFVTYASLFFGEDNPSSIEMIREKAANGVKVRIALGDPDSPETRRRGDEEGLPVPGRIRMALRYYRPLVGAPGVEFHLHRTTLYNSIYRFDDDMLINQHIYGTYGYLAPILHLRELAGGELFPMYQRSFDLVWATSQPYEPTD